MCCVLWDLCVCFLCQNGIYISDANKRFFKSTVTLSTKCRTEFYLPSLWDKGHLCPTVHWLLVALASVVRWVAKHELGWWPCPLVLFGLLGTCRGLISVKYPWALGRAEVHPENRDLGFGSPPCCLLGPLCHTQGLLPAPCRVGSVSTAGKVN